MEVIDQPLIQASHSDVRYAGFGPRLGAMILDGLILAPVTLPLFYFNMTTWKSVWILLLITFVSILYKPMLEFLYGATWGKMAVKIRVVNQEMKAASLEQILMRNIFGIVPGLLQLFFTMQMYSDPEFEYISDFWEYSTFTQGYATLQAVNMISGLITLADGIILLADKRSRSLHDKIAGTFVIHDGDRQ